MIKIDQLTKSYGRFKALDCIGLKFDRGQAVSLLGPNGSGKTTLIKSILGLVIPEEGHIYIDGSPVNKDYSYRSMIGYMPQIGRYPDNMTIEQVINMIQEIRTDSSSYDMELVTGLGIDKMKHKTMRSLSGGTRQKVSACLAFMFSPEILILDEPTAGLDPVSSELLKEKIIAEINNGKLVLMTSHVLSDLEGLTTDVVYLQDGKLVFYKPVGELKDTTGENRLNSMVTKMVQRENRTKNCLV